MVLPHAFWRRPKELLALAMWLYNPWPWLNRITLPMQVREMFHCVKLTLLDVNLGWGLCFTWRLLKHDFSFLQADGQSKSLGCLYEAVDDNLEGFFCVR